jgi:hypothetical protein
LWFAWSPPRPAEAGWPIRDSPGSTSEPVSIPPARRFAGRPNLVPSPDKNGRRRPQRSTQSPAENPQSLAAFVPNGFPPGQVQDRPARHRFGFRWPHENVESLPPHDSHLTRSHPSCIARPPNLTQEAPPVHTPPALHPVAPNLPGRKLNQNRHWRFCIERNRLAIFSNRIHLMPRFTQHIGFVVVRLMKIRINLYGPVVFRQRLRCESHVSGCQLAACPAVNAQ